MLQECEIRLLLIDTMRTLYLLRHAKSSWKDDSLRDFDRPLKDRGREAAKRMGKQLAQKNQTILS